MTSNFSHVRPATLDEALAQLAGAPSRLHAGGTDLLGCLRDHVFDADRVVSLSALDELRGVRSERDGGLRLGALTTVAQLAASPALGEGRRVLAEAATAVASPQIRNQGTVGGNLCQKPRCWYYRGGFPCRRKGGETCFAMSGDNRQHAILGISRCCVVHPSDLAPALIALDARALIGRRGRPREIALADFFVGPAQDVTRETVLEPREILTEVRLPKAPAGLRSGYRKVRFRRSFDFALASAAIALVMDGALVRSARIVLGGVAPVPWRSEAAEDEIVGHELSTGTIRAAARAAVADADPLSENEYKVPLVQGTLEAELQRLAG